MEQQRVIRVTGKGVLKVKPDMTRITITLKGCYINYEQALHMSSEDTEKLKDILEKQGFDRSDVKTVSFNVDTKNERYQAKDKGWKERLVGYEYTHVLKVEFDSDNKRLGRILYALANATTVHPVFCLSYTVKDKEASKNALLGKAVEDAKAKAFVLSQAAGVSLQEILNIDYSWGEINFDYSPMRGDMLMCLSEQSCTPDGYDMNIEPDDMEVSDTVTVVWGIE
jgi:uncharacterized protein YggE